MRICKKAVPKLTKTDVIEVYGLSNHKKGKYSVMDDLRLTTTSDNAAYHENCCNFKKVAGSTTDNQIFSGEPPSSAADRCVEDNREMNANVKRSNSKYISASGSSTYSKKSDGSSSRFRSITWAFRKTLKSVDNFGNKSIRSNKTTACQVPASRLSNKSHRGFLDRYIARKQWKRNYADQHRSNSPALSVSGASSASLESTDSNDDFATCGNLTQSYLKKRLDQELVEMQKHKLLREIVTQQQQILEDQNQLSHKNHQNVLKQNFVIDKYERACGVEEAKMTKHMTLLNRRRNSVQLKVDQLSREIAPTSGKKRRQNHQQFAALEAKLREMRLNLQKIDGEIHLLQTKKQNTIEKILERQELELLLTEQQENLAIMRRHEQKSPFDLVNRRCHVPSRSRDAMTSIDELSSISDCCSSASSDSMNESKRVLCSMSTPRYPRTKRPDTVKSLSTLSITSDEFEHIMSRSSDNDTTMSQYDSSSSLDGPIASSSLSSSSSSLPHRSNTVDPAIMADIEMFAKFSTMHLQKLQLQSPLHQ